jgi:transcriptional regulator of acetoin/glycerol metabolism
MTLADLQAMKRKWAEYVNNNLVAPKDIRPYVAESWQRCRKLNIDPYCSRKLTISPKDLKQRRAQFKDLIRVALPTIKNIYNFVRHSGFNVVLADEDGYLLLVMGDGENFAGEHEVQLCPGANWAEIYKGTNAIGTCLVERQPIHIHAVEHFCKNNHLITSSASPIFDPNGQLIGVLNMTGEYRHANDHTLGIVVAGANAIENQLRLHCTNKKLYSAYKYSETIINTMSEGLMTVNTEGVITQFNNAAAQIIDTTARNAIGCHVSQILSKATPILDMLRTGTNYENQEVVFEKNQRRFYSSGRLLYDDYSNCIGAVAVLKSYQKGAKNQPKEVIITQPARYHFDDIIGNCALMKETKRRAEIASSSPSTVLLYGESGTGKELFAHSIHTHGPRSNKPFVAINCSATPEGLIESELFGYATGSFTGASKKGKAGKFEIADGGTLFLDEIGDMPMHTQVKLLRVIQERKVTRVGSSTEIPVDIRIIAATHKDLKKEMELGNFREDLYYRLNVILIRIPPLRERLDDIPALVESLVNKLSLKLDRHGIQVTKPFLRACYAYPWPGNVRELENALERAINMVREDGILTAELMELNSASLPVENSRDDLVRPLKDMEKDLLIQALKKADGNIVQASKMLGISRNTIYRKIKEFDLSPAAAETAP